MKTKARELGITEFPYEERDSKGNRTYLEFSNGGWVKYMYDENGNRTYLEYSGEWCKRKFSTKGKLTYYEWYDGDKKYIIR